MSELERCERCRAAIIGDPWTNGIDTLCRECCIADVNRSAAIHSAEREVLEACGRWANAAPGAQTMRGLELYDSYRRYRALLDGKEEA